jgi:hypothetical protein
MSDIPHTPQEEAAYAPGLVSCPRCTDAVVDLDAHLKWCNEPESEPEPVADQLAAARALLAEDEQQRMKACLADIEAALDKHGMNLDITPARVILTPRN